MRFLVIFSLILSSFDLEGCSSIALRPTPSGHVLAAHRHSAERPRGLSLQFHKEF